MIDISDEELNSLTDLIELSDEELQKIIIDEGNKILAKRNEIIEEKKELEELLVSSDKNLQAAISTGDTNIIAFERHFNKLIKKRIDAADEVLEKTELSASIAKELNRKMLISKLLGGVK